MDITINNKYILITLFGGTQYAMTYKQLADVEKAIKIIRNMQDSFIIESVSISTKEQGGV